MKLVIISAVVAVVASIVTTMLLNRTSSENVMTEPQINYEEIIDNLDLDELSVSEQPVAAAWIRLETGSASSEQKILANAANSACFLTHVEINGIQSATDKNSCSITLDDFTGFWQVNATTGEGTQSELYCNARCVVWE